MSKPPYHSKHFFWADCSHRGYSKELKITKSSSCKGQIWHPGFLVVSTSFEASVEKKKGSQKAPFFMPKIDCFATCFFLFCPHVFRRLFKTLFWVHLRVFHRTFYKLQDSSLRSFDSQKFRRSEQKLYRSKLPLQKAPTRQSTDFRRTIQRHRTLWCVH